MYKNLSPGAIGIRNCSLEQAIALAAQSGFGGIDVSIQEVAALATDRGLEYVKALFSSAGVLPGQWNMPVRWQADEETWRQDLAMLPQHAALAKTIGCTRSTTWCPPGSDERDYAENLAWHLARFRPIAQILADNGSSFGIEFIGPKTSRSRRKYEFIYTLEGMMDLASQIGTGNVGLLLDAWHLYTSGGSVEDLDQISAEDIVTVHVNDAPEGLALEEQVDNDRRLPMETGVIDLPGFMGKLSAMGYDGPVTPEPFSKRINAIDDPVEAARLAAVYMDKLWKAGGLG
ncbi:MAG: sugar phosphate isomerase/epimerase [Chloroflexi bacterium]|nr:sugar phosphate isomerase/epimerase [Chloroflexota bacterium]